MYSFASPAGVPSLTAARGPRVPGGDVHEAVLLDDELALRALAGGGRAGDHHALGAGGDHNGPRGGARGGRARRDRELGARGELKLRRRRG